MARKTNGPSVSFFAFQDIVTSVVGIFVLITLIMMIELVSKVDGGQGTSSQEFKALESAADTLQQDVSELSARFAQLEESANKNAAIFKSSADILIKEINVQASTYEAMEDRGKKMMASLERQLAESKSANAKIQELYAVSKQDLAKKDQLLGDLENLDSKLNLITLDDPVVFRNAKIAGKSVIILDIHPTNVECLELDKGTRTKFAASELSSNLKTWISKQSLSQTHFLLFVRPGASAVFERLMKELSSVGASYGFDVLGFQKKLSLRQELK